MKADTSLAAFDEKLAAHNLHGQWKIDAFVSRMTDGQVAGPPHLWPRGLVEDALNEACVLLPESMTARRNITFVNPGLSRRGSTQTIIAGMQMVMPGEVAWAHRHTINALRFVVSGSDDLYTVVDGDRVPMRSNDLVLTPGWTWHDHHNESDRRGLWLDVLDSPLVVGLSQTFYEPFGAKAQTPAGGSASSEHYFPWHSVRETLLSRASDVNNPFEGYSIEYRHQRHGGSVLSTLSARIQVIGPKRTTEARRTTASAIYYVVAGSGTTTAGESRIEWDAGDTFAIPNWLWHSHRNTATSDAVFFVVGDEPLLEKLELYREEPEDSRHLRACLGNVSGFHKNGVP